MFKTSLIFMAILSLVACDKSSSIDNSESSETSISNPVGADDVVLKPLDLSLPEGQALADDDVDFTEKNSTPNLFDQEAEEKKYSVGGDVLRDKENLDYVDSVEGAQISVEMKIP